MKQIYIAHIASQMGLKEWQVENCAALFEEGDTIPFISRYRKEKTGGMDDASVAELKHWVDVFAQMEKRKETVLAALEEAGALSDEVRLKVQDCVNSSELEDIYLPYRPKRRTRATAAKELGLEPLADLMWKVRIRDPLAEARKYVAGCVEMKRSGKQGAASADEALSGARDIIAERLSETASVRENLRAIYRGRRVYSKVTKSGKESPDAAKYRSYFDFSHPVSRIPSYNLLAMLRARDEGFLSVGIDADAQKCGNKIYYDFCQEHGYPSPALADQIRMAVDDSFKRLLDPSVTSEVLKEAKEKADLESIAVFGENLRQLLLGAPVGQKCTMAIDPGFRNGCKIACLDAGGRLLHHEIIYPHPPQNQKVAAIAAVQRMLSEYGIQAVAIGNGTASRETEEFMRKIQLPSGCSVWTVSEDGASIYSASDVAREEFPDEDVTVRGAVSIGRRLMDPLSELVKIDPKNLGIGQYQHDVDQTLLKEKLDNTVESCVNSVGVNLNTASPYLLQYVSGIGTALSRAIVAYRESNGGFTSREELLKVPRLGAKAYEQCAGFLRIKNPSLNPSSRHASSRHAELVSASPASRHAELVSASPSWNPLDDSAVHPESYWIVDKMASDLGVSVGELVGNAELCSRIQAQDYVGPQVGLPTVNDILKELVKPGLDPREQASEFRFADDIHDISDLYPGMELPGIVTNITAFGAFVDIGLHDNGLIHVSQMGGRGADPSKVVKLHQKVRVSVVDVDLDRNRIGLRLLK